MPIEVRKLMDNAGVVIIDSTESIAAFKQMVHRATNLWPDAPPEIKAFADEITNADWISDEVRATGAGKGLQDYAAQDTSKKKEHVHNWLWNVEESRWTCRGCRTDLSMEEYNEMKKGKRK